jgi:hypothetical protein
MVSNFPPKNACRWFDITISCDKYDNHLDLIEIFNNKCDKWCIQKEKGATTGFLHFQCRVQMKVKTRTPNKVTTITDARWSVTSTENTNNFDYQTKNYTRVEGPWTNDDDIIYIPRQVRKIKEWFPFQKEIENTIHDWDENHINLIYDPSGWCGKTSIINKMYAEKKAMRIPATLKDANQLMQFCYCQGRQRAYMMDVPRSMVHQRFIWIALEELKSGYCYDTRYAGKSFLQDSPNIWVFTNTMPDISFLTRKRWKIRAVRNGVFSQAIPTGICNNIFLQTPGTLAQWWSDSENSRTEVKILKNN